MKYIKKTLSLLLIFMLFSCASHKKKPDLNIKDAIITYTKHRCLSNCPVYDLFVFKNGTILYQGIDHVAKKGAYKGHISIKKLQVLKQLLNVINYNNIPNNSTRDVGLTSIRFNNNKIVFRETSIKDELRTANNFLKSLINDLAPLKRN